MAPDNCLTCDSLQVLTDAMTELRVWDPIMRRPHTVVQLDTDKIKVWLTAEKFALLVEFKHTNTKTLVNPHHVVRYNPLIGCSNTIL